MDKANFLLKDSFPFSTKSADFLQQSILLLQKLTAIGGNNFVLSGCEEVDGIVSDGIVIIDNEILPLTGGAIKAKIIIVEERETVNAFGVEYPDAYVNRHVAFSDTGDLNWSDFQQIISNQELWQRVKDIKGDPPGIRVGWCGFIDKIPNNYMLCKGQALNIAEYPELYENIGTSFGAVGTTQFKLPNLEEKFVVGYSGNGDYNLVGNTGGLDEVPLTDANLPNHDHVPNNSLFNKLSVKASDLTSVGIIGSASDANVANKEYRVADMTEALWQDATIQEVGNNEAHENRPPFFVEAFIIKVKY